MTNISYKYQFMSCYCYVEIIKIEIIDVIFGMNGK